MIESTLHVEKISLYDRLAEPVSVSIPFAQGLLRDPADLAVADPASGARYPLQPRVLGRWEDGSIKWLLVHFQPDLPGNHDKTLTLQVGPQEAPVEPETQVTVTETEDGVRVDTGVLSFVVARAGYLPLRDVTLGGRPLFGPRPFGGFRLTVDGRMVGTADAPVE
ncbi:MAG TPA: hypothetical protein VLC52_14375, partial [Anaerolineae bacterium]|nr:hypothetical protein [Anaerolineae bacterium]